MGVDLTGMGFFLRVLQRGSEELMSHNSMVTNGTGLSPQLQGEMNDAKKVSCSCLILFLPSVIISYQLRHHHSRRGI